MPKLSSILTSILLILILLNIGPSLVTNIVTQYQTFFDDKTQVGRLKINCEIDDITFYQQELEKFFKDPNIKAILLELDSPGGAAGSSQALFSEIMQLKTEYKKPVVVLTYNICTSGAYYIACASDCIIASPLALIGSIGSYTEQFKLDKLLERCSIGYDIQKSGAYKATANFFVPSTPEQKQMLQETSDSCYQTFLRDISHRRGLAIAHAEHWANGKIFTGEQALKLHLIDELGSEYNARLKIKQLALIERDIEWVYPVYQSWWSQLFSSDSSGSIKNNVFFSLASLFLASQATTGHPALQNQALVKQVFPTPVRLVS